jgi:hypothetical protein
MNATTEKRQFTTEELDLLYSDVLLPNTNKQYDIVYDRLIEQFSIHQSFNLRILDLFVNSTVHTHQEQTVIQLFQQIINENESLVVIVSYGLSKLLYKIGEYIQSYSIAKSLVQKELMDVNLKSSIYYLLGKIYMQYYYGQDENIKYCFSMCYHSSPSYKLFNKYCEYYIIKVLLTSDRECIEYGKLNAIIGIQHALKEKVVIPEFNRMNIKKLTTKLSLLKQLNQNIDNDTKLQDYEYLQYCVYKLKNNEMEYDEELLHQFNSIYKKLIHADLNKLRDVGIYLAIRSNEWRTCIQYCDKVLKYCPTIDRPVKFYRQLALFHSQYSLIFELAEDQIEDDHKWNIQLSYEGIKHFDIEFLRAKTYYVMNNEKIVSQYELILQLLLQNNNTLYEQLLSKEEIRYEAHGVIGTTLYRLERSTNSAIYHLYHALLINEDNPFVWECFVQCMRREQLPQTNTILYIKVLYLYLNYLREQEAQENTELVMNVSNEINRYNSRIQLVDLNSHITLPSLINDKFFKNIQHSIRSML